MLLKSWEDLPIEMQTEEVKKYYEKLKKKSISLCFKRIFDIFFSLLLLIILSPVFFVLAIMIKIDSKGPVFYRQIRMTQYNKEFHIFKFRTMYQDADKGSQVTISADARITRVGKIIRNCRLDEISQLLNVLAGTMTFVATRAEVPRYTKQYTPEMLATLLLPAGVTSLASILYKDEAQLLNKADDADRVYVEEILPAKMHYNLYSLEHFSIIDDFKILFMTVCAVLGKEYGIEKTKEKK